ncbi:MAG: DUF1467 family protein [Paracoccaceae bacterium]|nr:DUF1467 family protein [Paracoccaceae bacterium]
MSITSIVVLFVVTWFMVMLVTLPINRRTQGDEGDVMPGTQAGAPANFDLKRTAKIVTLVTIVIWAILCGIIISGVVTIDDIDIGRRMRG